MERRGFMPLGAGAAIGSAALLLHNRGGVGENVAFENRYRQTPWPPRRRPMHRGPCNRVSSMPGARPRSGPLSMQTRVGDFGDDTIVGFDSSSRRATGCLRDADGDKVEMPGLPGLVFGAGASLGDADAPYFAAGPADETESLSDSLHHTEA